MPNRKEMKHTPTAEQVIKLIKATKFKEDGGGYEITLKLPINDLEMKVIDIRGWGYLTSQGGLKMDGDEAIKVQKFVATYLTEAVNQHTHLKQENEVMKDMMFELVGALDSLNWKVTPPQAPISDADIKRVNELLEKAKQMSVNSEATAGSGIQGEGN